MKVRVRQAFADLTEVQTQWAIGVDLIKTIAMCVEQEGRVFKYLLN